MQIEVPNINCDLGEGGLLDTAIMPLIHSCNIACGGHFGDPSTIANAIQLAVKNKVLIGAHPSYPDKENFGRISLNISTEHLISSIQEQIDTFLFILNNFGAKMNHIKLHGALYHQATVNHKTAETVAEALKKYESTLSIYLPPNSLLEEKLKSKFRIIYEGFVDRKYQKDGSLLSRSEKGSVIKDPHLAIEQFLNLWKFRKVEVENGGHIPFEVNTYCVHSDTENSLEILKLINEGI